jgi:hypothetical protein
MGGVPLTFSAVTALDHVAALLDEGDVREAIRLLRTEAEGAAPAEVAAALGRAAGVMDFTNLAAAAEAAVRSPGDPQALYDLGYACVDRGVADIAVPVLRAALEAAPGQRAIVTELAAALEQCHRYPEAVAMLQANDRHLQDWPDRYLIAFNSIMAGDVATARAVADRLSTPDGDWIPARQRLADMLSRADTVPGPLDHRALRGWHYVLNGALLLHVSPYGYDEPMHGRYAYVQDSLAGCRRTIDRLGLVLHSTGLSPVSVSPLPDRASTILGLATAQVLGLPVLPWQESRPDTIVVAYQLGADGPPPRLLTERTAGSILLEHATSWTDSGPVAPDVSGLLFQAIVAPWGEQMSSDPHSGAPTTKPADARAAELIAEEIAATVADVSELAPGDSDDDLSSFAAAVHGSWPATGQRSRLWSPGPVPSAYFR